MQNLKKVALVRGVGQSYLSGEIKGVAKLCKNGVESGISLSLNNLPKQNEGNYFVLLDDRKHELNDLYGGFFKCNEDFCGGVAVFFNGKEGTIPIAYGKFSPNAKSIEEMTYSETNNNEKKEIVAQKADIFSAQEYDDEAIATDDYYKFSSEGGVNDNPIESNGNEIFGEWNQDKRQEEKESDSSAFGTYENEHCEKNEYGATYYERIKEQLENIFQENPKEVALENMVKNSRWIRVGKGESSYVVGVIYFNEKPRYICYGVLGRYLSKPSEIKTYSSFIPKSPFNLKGEGYWVMFQDAISGESDKL